MWRRKKNTFFALKSVFDWKVNLEMLKNDRFTSPWLNVCQISRLIPSLVNFFSVSWDLEEKHTHVHTHKIPKSPQKVWSLATIKHSKAAASTCEQTFNAKKKTFNANIIFNERPNTSESWARLLLFKLPHQEWEKELKKSSLRFFCYQVQKLVTKENEFQKCLHK